MANKEKCIEVKNLIASGEIGIKEACARVDVTPQAFYSFRSAERRRAGIPPNKNISLAAKKSVLDHTREPNHQVVPIFSLNNNSENDNPFEMSFKGSPRQMATFLKDLGSAQ